MIQDVIQPHSPLAVVCVHCQKNLRNIQYNIWECANCYIPEILLVKQLIHELLVVYTENMFICLQNSQIFYSAEGKTVVFFHPPSLRRFDPFHLYGGVHILNNKNWAYNNKTESIDTVKTFPEEREGSKVHSKASP